MKKIDFSKVNVEHRIGEHSELDLRKTVANAIYQNTADIGLSDFARKIYYAEEPVEMPGNYAEKIVSIIGQSSTIMAAAKTAVIGLITGGEEVKPFKK